MLYSEYMHKAKRLEIMQDSESEIWYLNPEWKMDLFDNDLGKIEDVAAPYVLTWNDIEDVLKLEVERRNNVESKRKQVVDWIYDAIFTQVDPAIMAEETEYIANMMDYLKFKADHPEIAHATEDKPAVVDEKVQQLLKSGMNFSKK